MSDVERRPWPRDGRFLIGADGTVVGPSGKSLTLFIGRHGYRRFNRYDAGQHSQHSVHVAVCETFHGARPDGMWAAHDNGDELDNRAENLAWKTAPENEADKVEHGTRAEGERHGCHKLTEDQVRAIRASGTRTGTLSRRYGVSDTTIKDIRSGRTWRCLA